MVETFITLFTAHVIADFVLQTNWIIRHKAKLAVLTLHIAIVTGLSAVFLGAAHLPVLAGIAVTHFIADYLKIHVFGEAAWAFILDQLIHVSVIAGLAVAFPEAYGGGLWPMLNPPLEGALIQGCIILAGGIVAVLGGGYLIGKLLAPFAADLSDEHANGGFANGGRRIGELERLLTYVFVLADAPAAVGLLIAAKALLRFGDIRRNDDRKLTEYIIIGTFKSIAWALIAALAARAALRIA